MPTRTPEENIAKLEALPAEKIVDLLAALATGDLEGGKKVGGGAVTRRAARTSTNRSNRPAP